MPDEQGNLTEIEKFQIQTAGGDTSQLPPALAAYVEAQGQAAPPPATPAPTTETPEQAPTVSEQMRQAQTEALHQQLDVTMAPPPELQQATPPKSPADVAAEIQMRQAPDVNTFGSQDNAYEYATKYASPENRDIMLQQLKEQGYTPPVEGSELVSGTYVPPAPVAVQPTTKPETTVQQTLVDKIESQGGIFKADQDTVKQAVELGLYRDASGAPITYSDYTGMKAQNDQAQIAANLLPQIEALGGVQGAIQAGQIDTVRQAIDNNLFMVKDPQTGQGRPMTRLDLVDQQIAQSNIATRDWAIGALKAQSPQSITSDNKIYIDKAVADGVDASVLRMAGLPTDKIDAALEANNKPKLPDVVPTPNLPKSTMTVQEILDSPNLTPRAKHVLLGQINPADNLRKLGNDIVGVATLGVVPTIQNWNRMDNFQKAGAISGLVANAALATLGAAQFMKVSPGSWTNEFGQKFTPAAGSPKVTLAQRLNNNITNRFTPEYLDEVGRVAAENNYNEAQWIKAINAADLYNENLGAAGSEFPNGWQPPGWNISGAKPTDWMPPGWSNQDGKATPSPTGVTDADVARLLSDVGLGEGRGGVATLTRTRIAAPEVAPEIAPIAPATQPRIGIPTPLSEPLIRPTAPVVAPIPQEQPKREPFPIVQPVPGTTTGIPTLIPELVPTPSVQPVTPQPAPVPTRIPEPSKVPEPIQIPEPSTVTSPEPVAPTAPEPVPPPVPAPSPIPIPTPTETIIGQPPEPTPPEPIPPGEPPPPPPPPPPPTIGLSGSGSIYRGGDITGDTIITNLSGQVRDSLTNQPIVKSLVRIINSAGAKSQRLTDKKGRYQFTDINPDYYTVITTKEGYDPIQVRKLVNQGENRLDFKPRQIGITTIQAGRPSSSQTLIVPPSSMIPASRPLPKVVTSQPGVIAVKQGDSGFYTVIYPPYQPNNIVHMKVPPPDALILPNIGSAYKTIVSMGGNGNVLLNEYQMDRGYSKPKIKTAKKRTMRRKSQRAIMLRGTFKIERLK